MARRSPRIRLGRIGRVKVYREPRELLAIGEVTPDRRLAPHRVFVR